MTDHNIETKKRRVTKSLAVVGLLGVLVVLAWASVQIVQVAPSAYSALVSITDRVYAPTVANEEYELVTAVSNDIVDTGDETTLTWNETSNSGTYSFAYTCQTGVAFSIQSDTEDERMLPCDSDFDLGNTTEVTLIGTSEQRRFIDVPFTLTFVPDNNSRETVVANDTITLVNNQVSPVVEITDEDESAQTTGTEVATEPEVAAPETVASVDTTQPEVEITTPSESTPTPAVSTPAFVDLVTSLNGLGRLSGDTFINLGTIENDEAGALQFAVTNEGTVASDTWSYVVNLPGGTQYVSNTQAPLLAGSTALLTFGFTAPEDTGVYPFSISVIELTDIDQSSNVFQWSVTVE